MQGWFSGGAEEEAKPASSLLADWNSYAAQSSQDASNLGLSFDLESAVRSANDTVSGTFSVGKFDAQPDSCQADSTVISPHHHPHCCVFIVAFSYLLPAATTDTPPSSFVALFGTDIGESPPLAVFISLSSTGSVVLSAIQSFLQCVPLKVYSSQLEKLDWMGAKDVGLCIQCHTRYAAFSNLPFNPWLVSVSEFVIHIHVMVSKGVRDLPGNFQSATSSVPSGKSLVYFGLLLASGVFFVFLSFTLFLPVMVVMPQKFAICFTLGCGFIIGSFFALKGPKNQLTHMLSRERLPFTLAFLGSMIGTIYVSMVLHSYILSVVFSVVQVLSLGYYSISYFPGGSAGMKFLTSALTSSIMKCFGR
ncbi:unnamed protein product [Sphenostylis stenocarpa]|uniref:Vesicle transport protein n=1 Tax=Sphenostylis stenocarpa TaxID=92480 RepID=A0AA86VMY7_9FABA|nr:unnamed protein product [Sphenostylis stenocarpa]